MKLLPKLSKPETVRDSDDHGATLVHHAAHQGWGEVCKLLVEKYNCDPTAVDDLGVSPLHTACFLGRENSVKYLVTLPSVLRRINDKDKNFGFTPLHWACWCDETRGSVIGILLETNAVNIKEVDHNGRTPLEVLSRRPYQVLSEVAKNIDWSTQLPIESFFSVFLVGNSGAGKSTLAAAMLELTSYPTQHGRISNVEELTAGIVPKQCQG